MQEKRTDPRLRISPAKAYLVGGVPRTGKTTIARRLMAERPMFAISTDSIRMIQRNLVSEADYPELFEANSKFTETAMRELCAQGNASEIVDAQNAESEIVWRSVKDFIEGTVAEGFDVLVEGVAILPKLVDELNCDFRAVFVGNSSLERPAMQRSAHADPLDWMHEYSDETFHQFSKFTALHSEYYNSEAKKHDLRYCEVKEETFEKDILSVLSHLLEP